MKQFLGRIDLIIGPMFAGKTTHLIHLIREYESKRAKCLVLNHSLDSRYSLESFLVSHNNEKIKAKKINKIEEIINDKSYLMYDVIAIDEAQFFPDITSGCDFLANNGKIVLASGLDGTFLRKPFNDLINLIPLAENVTKLHSICVKCSAPASFTKRVSSEEKEILVGSHQIYQPLCRKCYLNIEN